MNFSSRDAACRWVLITGGAFCLVACFADTPLSRWDSSLGLLSTLSRNDFAAAWTFSDARRTLGRSWMPVVLTSQEPPPWRSRSIALMLLEAGGCAVRGTEVDGRGNACSFVDDARLGARFLPARFSLRARYSSMVVARPSAIVIRTGIA